ncbi:toxin glutamine deamidase domain-containing protein [Nocardia sp. NPDC049220]|uniref:toxin glutamine deamidase domain-containing protein n=1 Tax=Nocardia sp. NPDC049220 TaxID=3155273 RepID=UPI0033C5968C
MQATNVLVMAFRRVAADLARAAVEPRPALDHETPALAWALRRAGEQVRRVMDDLVDMDRHGEMRLATHAGRVAEPREMTEVSSLRWGDDFVWFDPRSLRSDRVNREVDDSLARVSPHFDPNDPRRRNNCVAVATAYELRRRGYDVEAGQVSFPFEAGFPHSFTEIAWERRFTTVFQRSHLRDAFQEPGSRGIVIADWPPGQHLDLGDSHVFNVEHVPGTGIRFVDGQPNPPLTDATEHIQRAAALRYLRVDDLPDPEPSIVNYLGIHTPRR